MIFDRLAEALHADRPVALVTRPSAGAVELVDAEVDRVHGAVRHTTVIGTTVWRAQQPKS